MMTALLSVGAWATDHLWDGTYVMNPGYWGAIQDVTFPTDLTTNDVIQLTVNINNGWGYAIALCKKDGDNGNWSGTKLAEVTCDNDSKDGGDRIIEIPVTNEIINAIASASGLLTFNGQCFTMTSVDIERNVGGLTILTSGEASTWGSQKIQSRFISYASVGDVIEVTASRKSSDWGNEVYIKDGDNAETSNELGSGDLGGYGSEVPVKISVTAPMLAATNLYLWGGYFDISSVKLIFAHDVAINDMTNGTVSTDKSRAVPGAIVTLTPVPDGNYEISGVPTVTDGNSDNVTVTANVDGTYSFTMPATAVTVNATFNHVPAVTLDTENIKLTSSQRNNENGGTVKLWIHNTEENGWDFTIGRPVSSSEFSGVKVEYEEAYNVEMVITYVDGTYDTKSFTAGSGSDNSDEVNFASGKIVTSIKFRKPDSNATGMIQFKSRTAVSLQIKNDATYSTPRTSLTLTYETLEDTGNGSVTYDEANKAFTIAEGNARWAFWDFTLPIPTSLYNGINFTLTEAPEGSAIEIVYADGTVQQVSIAEAVSSETNFNVNFSKAGSITRIRFAGAGTYKMGTCTAKPAKYQVTVSAAQYATFGDLGSPDVINYGSASGLKAYIAYVDNGVVKLEEVSKASANEAVVLYANVDEATPYTVNTTDDSADTPSHTNQLHISNGSVTGSSGSGNIYVLAKKSGVVGFYKLASATKVLAGKAYLEISGGSAPAFIGFGDGTTGIDEVRSNTEEVRSDYHDLQGRRVAQPTKGLYIVNGKKVIIK